MAKVESGLVRSLVRDAARRRRTSRKDIGLTLGARRTSAGHVPQRADGRRVELRSRTATATVDFTDRHPARRAATRRARLHARRRPECSEYTNFSAQGSFDSSCRTPRRRTAGTAVQARIQINASTATEFDPVANQGADARRVHRHAPLLLRRLATGRSRRAAPTTSSADPSSPDAVPQPMTSHEGVRAPADHRDINERTTHARGLERASLRSETHSCVLPVARRRSLAPAAVRAGARDKAHARSRNRRRCPPRRATGSQRPARRPPTTRSSSSPPARHAGKQAVAPPSSIRSPPAAGPRPRRPGARRRAPHGRRDRRPRRRRRSAAAGARAGRPPPPPGAADRSATSWTRASRGRSATTTSSTRPGSSSRSRPTFSIGDRPQYRLFFDNLNSRFGGRENLTHLVLYKKMPGFIPQPDDRGGARPPLRPRGARGEHRQPEPGALRRRLVHPPLLPHGRASRARALGDLLPARHRSLPPRLPLRHLVGRHGRVHQPVDLPAHPGQLAGREGPVRRREASTSFVGFKTATIVQPQQILNPGDENDVEQIDVGETNYGFLGGAGVDPLENLHFDVGGGYFQQGKFDLDDVRGQHVYTYGGSARVVVHDRTCRSRSRSTSCSTENDPKTPMILFAPEKYDPERARVERQRRGRVPRPAPQGLRRRRRDEGSGRVRRRRSRASSSRLPARQRDRHLPQPELRRPQRPRASSRSRRLPGERARPIRSSSARSPPTTTSRRSHLTPGHRRRRPAPATFKSEFTDGGVPASRTDRRARAGRRVDPPVRPGSHADLPGAREPPLGHLGDPPRRRLGAVRPRQQRHARRSRSDRRHGVSPRSRARTASARRPCRRASSRVSTEARAPSHARDRRGRHRARRRHGRQLRVDRPRARRHRHAVPGRRARGAVPRRGDAARPDEERARRQPGPLPEPRQARERRLRARRQERHAQAARVRAHLGLGRRRDPHRRRPRRSRSARRRPTRRARSTRGTSRWR